jgi:hypothetical protein
MGLLAANPAHIDEQGFPVYLESSNRANDHRYERLGYRPDGDVEDHQDAVTAITVRAPDQAR